MKKNYFKSNIKASSIVEVSKTYYLLLISLTCFLFSTDSYTQSIISFTPTNACANSEISVIITGTGLTGATAVTFNNVAATTFTVDADNKITATLPATATSGTISVTTPALIVYSASSFIVDTPSIAPNNITGSTSICEGTSTTLTLNGGYSGTGAIPEWFKDSCEGTLIGTGSSVIVSPTANTSYFVRYNGTCNTTSCTSVTITVTDTQIPTIATLSDISVNVDPGVCTYASSQLTAPNSTDNCSVASVVASPATLALGTNTVTWTVTDGSGLTATTTQLVTVTENIDPTITAPADVNTTTNLDCTATGVVLGTPATGDNCSVASVTNNAPAAFPLGNTTVTWTVTDGSGLTATTTQLVTVTDNIDPTITAPADVNTTTNSDCTATGVVLGTPATGDNCSVASVTNNAPAAFPLGNTTVTWTVTDGAGRTATATQVVTVADNINPTITAPAPANATTNSGCTATGVVLGTPVTGDNCSLASVTNNAPAAFPLGNTTVTWTVTDGAGRTATAPQIVTVTDNINPTITAPATVNATTNSGCTATAVVLGTPVTDDNCSVASVTNNAPAAFPLGNTTVTWTVTDGAGRTATATQIVRVTDNINPTITAPAAVNATTNSGCTATGVVLGTPATGDNCSVASVTSNAPAAFTLGNTTVTWTVTDGSGGTATATQVVTVADNINPTVNCPTNITQNIGAGSCTAIINTGNPITTDNCSVTKLTWTLSGATTGASATTGINNLGTRTFNLGTTTVTYNVFDATGNFNTCSYTVTVIDNINPTISCQANITQNVGAGTCTASINTTNPTKADNCSVTKLTWTLSGATTGTSAATGINNLNTQLFNLGLTTVTYRVEDAAGNFATCSYTVTISDNINPTITAPAAINATTNSGCTATGVVLGTPATGDNCSVASVTNNAPAAFPLGNTSVTWTVMDGSGRTATTTQVVTVADNINPTINCPTNITQNVGAGSCTASINTVNPITTDNCSVTKLTWTLSGATTGASATTGINNLGIRVFNLGLTTVTYRAEDAAGNFSTCSYIVTVIDNINPTISCQASITQNVGAGTCTASINTTNPTKADNCSVTKLTWTLSGATTGASATTGINNLGIRVFNLGLTTVTYRVEDAAGNFATCSYTVTITDNILPIITPGANQSAYTDLGVCTASVAVVDATFSDNCSGSTISYVLSGATTKAATAGQVGTYIFNKGVTTITYTVRDGASNIRIGTKTITVTDNENPTVTPGANQSALTPTGFCTASVPVVDAIFEDNCTGSTISYTLSGATTKTSTAGQVGTYTFNKGVTTITYTVTDGSGKTATATQTVTINDNTPPTLLAGANQSVSTAMGVCTASVAVLNATFGDNCTTSTISHALSGATTKTLTAGQVGTYTFNKGVTTVTYTVTDGSGNITTGTKTVTVSDKEKPATPTLSTITAQCSLIVDFPTTIDNCDGIVTATTSDNRTFNTQGTYKIIWSFKDSSDNETIVTQNVIIDDTTAPIPSLSSLPTLNFPGCQIDTLTPPTANDICTGITDGIPNISFPFRTLGTTIVTWTYEDGNGNIATQNQSITLTAPPISGGTLLGYISDVFTVADAIDNIAITSCPNDENPITLNLSGQIGTIVQWEKFEAGDSAWTIIENTTETYNIIFNFQNTKSTLFRVLIQVGNCKVYSNMVNVHAIPPDVPPILEANLFTICLNDPITLVARNGYTSAVEAGNGGDFNIGQFPNKWDPTQWKIDGEVSGTAWTAAANNTKVNNWTGTNDAKNVGTEYIIKYDNGTQGKKFGMAHGNYNSTEYISKFGVGPTTLETPIFSLVGLGTASIDFDQAFNLEQGDYAKLELSLDGGISYTITLQELIGTSDPTLTWDWQTNPPSTASYYMFANDNSSFDISEYIGNDNVRVKWTFFGTTDESVWAIDNITIPVKPYSDQLEWTDGIGDPTIPPLASGTINVAYTFVPTSPGVHQYGATSIINECRAYDPDGTALATVQVNYSYAGEDITPVIGKCGGTTVSLNAYDNTKSAEDNKANGAYTRELDTFSDDPGTGQIGTWSVFSSTNISCGSGSFSNVNDPKATFTGTAGTYVLRWTVANCFDDVQVTLENCDVIDFDGEDDYITFKNNYNLNSSFSIGVWIKPETQPASGTTIQSIFSKRNGDNFSETNGYDLRLDNNNYISFNWNNGGAIKSSYPISTSRWYHIGVTYNGTTYKLYIDGIEIASTAGSAPATNTLNCILGAMNSNAKPNEPINYFSGWMEELQIWNVALTPDQLHQIMNQKINVNGTLVRGEIIPIDIYGLTWSNLNGYYRMTDLSCGYLKSFSGVGVDGRLMNITTSQSQTAPLPYLTVRDGNWTDRGTLTTPWLYGSGVWDYPNSTGINGKPIDWNIVVSSHNLNSDDKDITLLGLITNPGTKLKIVAPAGTQDETNSGHMLWLTHYLKLDGFIDLIGESQLLQKRYYNYPDQYNESIFDEASSGYIERDQQGQKNSFNYNYWSSPVSIQGGPNNSPYSIAGVLRDGTNSATPGPITFGDGAYFADGPLSSPIKISRRWIWSYNSATPDSNTNWQNYYQWNFIQSAGLLKTGEGYTMKGTGGTAPITSMQNYVFSGKPNSGTITLNIPLEQTYLIGNPYPSALDANKFIKDNLMQSTACPDCTASTDVFTGALYFWDHFGITNNHILAQYTGGYATYTLMGSAPAIANDPLNINNGLSGSKVPKQYIPVAQAFFVNALPLGVSVPVTNQLIFNNSQRQFIRENQNPVNSLFMKTTGTAKTNTAEPEADIKSKIRLGFDSSIGAHRQLLIGADPNTTSHFDIGYDAPMFGLNDDDMFWEINNDPFVIQAISDFNENQIIPLGLTIKNEGLVTVRIDALENIPETTQIHLYDSLTASYHNIKNKAFSISLAVGEYNNRFSLRFTGKTLSVNENNANDGIIVLYSNNYKVLIIQNNLSDTIIEDVSLFNLLGQAISNWNIENEAQTRIQIPVKNVSSGVYVVKLKTSNGDFSKKIIIK